MLGQLTAIIIKKSKKIYIIKMIFLKKNVVKVMLYFFKRITNSFSKSFALVLILEFLFFLNT
jgi:hypothetical protein